MTTTFRTTAGEPLAGDVDFDLVLGRCGASEKIKGMFFNRYVAALGAEWEELEPQLDAPAKHGRYHAFEPYPMRDYLRLFDRVARARMPNATREGYRLLARGEIEVFASSTLGRVTFALLKDPAGAFRRYAEILRVVTSADLVEAEPIGDRRVLLTHGRFRGAVEQGLGICEGLVLAFDETPRVVTTSSDDEAQISFEVSW